MEVAFKCGRPAEALLIAKIGGDELFSRTLEEFFNHHNDPFIKYALKHIYNQDIEGFVGNHAGMAASMVNWRESLILAVNSHNRNQIAAQLGSELMKREMVHEARICFMVAGQFDQVLELWVKDMDSRISQISSSKTPRPVVLAEIVNLLRDVLFKSWTLLCALEHKQMNAGFDKLVLNFVEFALAGGQDPYNALTLFELTNISDPQIAELYNRIFMSSPRRFSHHF